MALLDNENIEGDLTPMILQNMQATSGWMKFVSSSGLIMSILYLILMLYTFFSYLNTGLPGLGAFYVGILISIIFLLAMIISFVFLLQYANNLGEYINTKQHKYLEIAFVKQKIYWIIIGIFTVLGLLYTSLVILKSI